MWHAARAVVVICRRDDDIICCSRPPSGLHDGSTGTPHDKGLGMVAEWSCEADSSRLTLERCLQASVRLVESLTDPRKVAWQRVGQARAGPDKLCGLRIAPYCVLALLSS